TICARNVGPKTSNRTRVKMSFTRTDQNAREQSRRGRLAARAARTDSHRGVAGEAELKRDSSSFGDSLLGMTDLGDAHDERLEGGRDGSEGCIEVRSYTGRIRRARRCRHYKGKATSTFARWAVQRKALISLSDDTISGSQA